MSYYISRDAIRFSILKEGEPYFSHEKEVYEKFINEIVSAINHKWSYVIIDATHVSLGSRNKLFRTLQARGVNFSEHNLKVITMMTSREKCKEQNAKRTGLSCVSDEVIDNMYQQLQNEPFELWEVEKYNFKCVSIEYIYYRDNKNEKDMDNI